MGRHVAVMLARLIAEAKLGLKDKNYEKKISEKSLSKKKIEKKINGKSINKKKIEKKIAGTSINKKKIEKKVNGTSINKKKSNEKRISEKSHGGLGVYPNRQNVSGEKSRSRKAAAFGTQKQKRGIEYGTA